MCDVHGEFQALGWVMDMAEKDKPDIVVCPGNITDMFKSPTEFSQLDVADVVVQKLLSLGKPVLCLPGNHDPFEILDVFGDYGVNLHGKRVDVGGVGFLGFGGAQTPFNTLFEPTEEEVAASLGKLGTKQPFVFVVHNPPKSTKMDKIASGEHVGSKAVREFVLSKKPVLTLTSHIHEAAGTDKLGGSVLFNPGPAFKGRYGIVDIEKGTVKCVIRKV